MLLGLKGVTYRIGTTVLLDQVEFSLEERERVALVGRNGAGKSTLFRIISREIQPEDGQVIQQDGLKLARLEQAVPEGQDLTIEDVVAQGLGEIGSAVLTAKRLAERMDGLSDADMQALHEAQTLLGEHNGWHLQSELDQMLSRMNLQADLQFASLSGGMKRKVMLAKALVNKPDVLLLDEPTNHLDIPSIELLEEQIRQFPGAVILVSHDRAFMRRLATRVCDLDRGSLKSWSGGYEGYLKGKAEFLAAEEKANALFDKRLAEEEVWIRRGIEARRTRNEGRVRALLEMRKQYAGRRNLQGSAKVQVQEADRSGKVVAEIEHVNLTLDDFVVLDDFSAVILRGEKIGVLGPNGIGKTTALRVLLGQIKADSGSVKLGTKLEIAYFDQLRNQFNEEDTAVDIIGGGKEFIQQGGQSKHVIGYLQDFLFTPDRARQPVRSLSGGERARLLLAQLFAQPSNILVLDEPTNDLDIETLELLEEKLCDYTGTVILVSHDREFLNQIVTRCLVFEGEGRVGDYVGGYDDWLRQRTVDPWSAKKADSRPRATAATPGTPTAPATAPKTRKLSYKETRELESLPGLIESLENEQAELVKTMSEPDFYNSDPANIQTVNARMADIEKALTQAYARWETLEGQ
ncbi:ATP-binding cassette domain-containing protein [Limnobacter sp.]|uniref:ATP-binding cassette domain-containing protein n=1 Tax=Limnobacter sp. TaxID=2003368 RepID=UPI0025909FDE|nr:ATP-binding cassette domain-containing protein [Limnobacter sp.]HEX5484466.1 ATP-binding cassette domain-containing protein [Limnobacter sp.]